MTKIIKESIDKIDVSNSQKKKMYDKIIYKNSFDINALYKVAVICLLSIFCFTIIGKPNKSEELMIVNTREIIFNDEIYDQIDIPYELGDIIIDNFMIDKEYEVYSNDIDDNSIILYNEFYEVYVRREE